jgi:nitrite reductase/ring-hydroxylating ferredoxin subunit
MANLNRRSFLYLSAASIGAFFALTWAKLLNHSRLNALKKKKILAFDPNKEVAFFDNYIIVNRKGKTQVFSSHCTHLGCSIHQIEDQHFVCPCHGSQFDMDGNAIKGPAFKALEKHEFSFSKDRKSIQLRT